ncbi:MAG TPA: amino acid adenylation domain-containing protein [Thermoanaerobaculia bacterium]|nr:amino acid adenylation domain-containing protein [Thermoanaerobaculia bacterium]
MEAVHRSAESFFASASLAELLARRADHSPHRRAFAFLPDGEGEEIGLSFADLDAKARVVAAALGRQSAGQDRVLLIYPPGLEFVTSFFGCLYAGAIAIPSYTPRFRVRQPRLAAIARDAEPTVVLTTAAYRDRAQELTALVPELAAARWLATDELPLEGDQLPGPACGRDDIAFLQYTSGSTSTPKGVVVHHHHLMHNEEMIRRAFDQSADSVVVSWLPLFHDMGLIGSVLQPVYLGASCVLMPPLSFLQQPRRWLAAIDRFRATTSGGPSFAYELCATRIRREEAEPLDLSCWRVAFNGSEPVRAQTLHRFSTAFAPWGFRRESFFPCYGLAEATLFVSGPQPGTGFSEIEVDAAALERHQVAPAGEGGGRRLIGCGRAGLGQEIAIVDPSTCEPVAAGTVGEIWLRGPCVAAGYWRQPAVSEALFQARLASDPHGAWLRTEDLGFTREGELFVTGRLKDLVILRGRNHYPSDLEHTAEASHPALRAASSAAFSVDREGEERLVLALELGPRITAESEQVVAAVRRAVGQEHDVAVWQVVLLRHGTLPKTSSGKVQRSRCRQLLELGELDVVASFCAEAEPADPPGTLEAKARLEPARSLVPYLLDQLAAVTGISRHALEADEETPIAALGLDSVAAVELKQRLESDLGSVVPLGTLFDGTTIGDLAHRVAETSADDQPIPGVATSAEAPPVSPSAAGTLSQGQRALWLVHQLDPHSAAYNLVGAARLHGDLDIEALTGATRLLGRWHPSLRAPIRSEAGEPRPVLDAELDLALEVREIADLAPEDLKALLAEEAHRPFDLERLPPARFCLFRSPRELTLLVVFHHLVVDFWSLGLLARELGEVYTALAAGGTPTPPSRGLDYTDFVAWQSALPSTPRGQALERYWLSQLSGALAPLELPADRPRPATQDYRGGTVSRVLAGAGAATEELARAAGGSPFLVLWAALAILLGRWCGSRNPSERRLVLGTPMLGRSKAGWRSEVGYFVNLVPLVADLAGDPSLSALLERLRPVLLGALEHQDYPFPMMVAQLGLEPEPSRSRLFQLMLVLHRAPRAAEQALAGFALGLPGARLRLAPATERSPGLELESLRFEHQGAPLDLSFSFAISGPDLAISAQLSQALYDRSTVESFLGHFETFLRAALREPDRRCSALPVLTTAERLEVLTASSEPPGAEAGPKLLHLPFLARAEEEPDATVLVAAEESWSAGALRRWSGHVAHHLVALGVGPETRVAVSMPRDASLVAALLGILEAGGAYVPLALDLPAERRHQLFEDSRPRLLIAPSTFDAPGSDLIRLDPRGLAVDPLADALPATDAANRLDPANLAYVLFTSGSTGRPKGVAVEHRSAALMVSWALELFLPQELALVVASTSIGFDLSVFEIFVPLAAGGTVLLVEDALTVSKSAACGAATLLNTVPSLAQEMLEGGVLPPRLRVLNLAGEALGRSLANALHRAARPERLLNLYGPTEDTTYSTWAVIAAGGVDAPAIGRSKSGSSAWVVDNGGSLAPLGMPGELYLGGSGLARGYLDRPTLTADRFVPAAFGTSAGARAYRTGDLARRRADGQLEHLGRLDHQVKIRGLRIELGEIGAALLEQPSVGRAVVVAREDRPGQTLLVAYLVPAEAGRSLALAELEEALRRQLPASLVPSVLVELTALPLNANGKVDRSALPAPEASNRAVEAARTPLEELLCGIWAEVLSVPVAEVGRNGSFFALGGHSLLAARVLSRVTAAVGIELPLRSLFSRPTVAALAEEIERRRRSAAEPSMPPLVRSPPPTGSFPLAPAQERIWFLEQLDPGLATFHVPVVLEIRGELEAGRVRRALATLVATHGALRTVFADGAQRTVARVAPPMAFLDLEALAPTDREREASRLEGQLICRPFRLDRAPLLRAGWLRLGTSAARLVVCCHHLVVDGWSLGLLLRDLAAAYEAMAQGGAAQANPPRLGYHDYVWWQRALLTPELLDRELAWAREHLANRAATSSPAADRPRPPRQSYRGGQLAWRLDEPTAAALATFGQRRGASPFMVLVALVGGWLSRVQGESRLVLGSVSAGRRLPELEGLVGMLAQTQVLALDLDGEPTSEQLLARARDEVLLAHDHQDLPFEKLVEALQPERSLAQAPIFQVLLVLQNTPLPPLHLAGAELDVVLPSTHTSKVDLSLSLRPQAGRLDGYLEFASDLFDRSTVERWVGQLDTLLAGMLGSPQIPVHRLPLLSALEARQVRDSNPKAAPWLEMGTLHGRIRARAAAYPDAVALVQDDRCSTYGDLLTRSAAVAARLRQLGVRPEERVAVCLERSIDQVVALLAVLQAGGAYVPLDPDYPAERLAYLLADSRPAAILTRRELAESLASWEGPVWYLDPDTENLRLEERGAPPDDLDPEQLAYVIYTSGSTGRPKGAMNAHRGVLNRLLWAEGALGLGRGSRWLQKTPLSFDVSVGELFGALLVGARLVLARPGDHRDPIKLAELIERERITILHFVPSMLAAFLEGSASTGPAGSPRLESLRQVLASGEALPAELARRFFAHFDAELHNLYGPTEAAVEVSHWACRPEGNDVRVPIGRPIANLRLHVLDRWQQPRPIGVPGELFLAGDGVGRGYWRRPGLTAERFLPDPFATAAGCRMYRSGDLARLRPDGAVDFLGRVDLQLKVRGFRIEPGEIEAALREDPRVADAVVIARTLPTGDVRIEAHCTASTEGERAGVSGAQLRHRLAERLPEHLVPARVAMLPALPLLANGKVDRTRLAAPAFDDDLPASPKRRAGSPLEELLAGLWGDLLGVSDLGAEADFFALGGHSLLATRLISRLRALGQTEVVLADVFEAPSPLALAARLEHRGRLSARGGVSRPPLLPRRAGTAPIPASFAQRRLWFLEQLDPGTAVNHLAAGLDLMGRLDLASWRAALGHVVGRHEALRTGFQMAATGLIQVIEPAGDRSAAQAGPLVDLQALEDGRRRAEAARLGEAFARRAFDLGNGSLLRMALLRLDEARHRALAVLHHLIADGGSMALLLAELSAVYSALAAGGQPSLPDPRLQYADFTLWQAGWLQGDLLASELAWWRARFNGEPSPLELPVDRPRPAMRSPRGAVLTRSLAPSRVAALEQLARDARATLFMVLLAGLRALLARTSGQREVVIGVPVAHRDPPELEEVIGLLVNTLALPLEVTRDLSFAALLAKERDLALGALAHQDLPFELLVDELGIARDLSRPPLFQVLASLQEDPWRGLDLAGLTVEPVPLATGTARFELALDWTRCTPGLDLSVEYATDLFDASTISRMVGWLDTLLASAASRPEQPLVDLPLLSAAEESQIAAWSGGGAAAATAPGLSELLSRQATLTPDTIALAAGEEAFSYQGLQRAAGNWARRLATAGVGPGEVVGIRLGRSTRLPVLLLGVLEAGGTYLPLEPGLPPERLSRILAAARPRLVVTEQHLTGSLAGTSVPYRTWEALEAAHTTNGHGTTCRTPVEDAAAYVLFTSGSTGEPKGVVVPRSALATFLPAMQRELRLSARDCLVAETTLSFDIAGLELFLPLIVGARIELAGSEDAADGRRLAALLERSRATVLQATPATWRLLLAAGWRSPHGFTAICGGEALSRDLADALLTNGAILWNVYGPTEATVWVSADRVAEGKESISIGRPLTGTRLHVADPSQRDAPIGVVGELLIGGPQLALGYVGQPGLTAERFVPDGLGAQRGARLYRTGDLARRLADGRLECLGRFDQQVKVRGFRIELGEIEVALRRYPTVAEAVVTRREEGSGLVRLVAYLVSPQGIEPDGLRRHLLSCLPDYMVPATFVVLDALPLLASGKVDRKALPSPEAAEVERPLFEAPVSDAEVSLAALWTDLLEHRPVSRHDRFFELGGDSILAMQLVMAAARAGLAITPRQVFEHPTLAGLAAVAEPISNRPTPETMLSPPEEELPEAELGRILVQLQKART